MYFTQSHADCFVDPTKTVINAINWLDSTHIWVPLSQRAKG